MCMGDLTYTKLYEDYEKLVRLKDYKTGKGYFYTSAISEFFDFLKVSGYSTFQITGQDMANYFHYLKTRPNKRRGGTLSDTSVNHHLFAIKILFDFLLDAGKFTALPLLPRYIRRKGEPLEVLTVDEMRLLYGACTTALEKALVSVAYGCGLRRSEIQNLEFTDIDLKKGTLIVRKGKNSKRREVPMSDMVIEHLREYIDRERKSDYLNIYALFVSAKRVAMSGETLNNTIKKIISRVPVLQSKSISLHTLRRSIATHLIEQGASVHFVKNFLGHSNIDTSQLYALKRKRKTRIQ